MQTVKTTNASEIFSELWGSGSPPDVFEFLASNATLDPDAKLEILLVDQEQRHRIGAGVPAEDYLAAVPEIAADEELRFELVYGEYRLRRGSGEAIDSEQLMCRFPSLVERIVRHSELSKWLQAEPAGPVRQHGNASPRAAGQQETLPLLSGAPTTAVELDPNAPLSLDDYELGRLLGSGGMGDVYAAKQRSLNKPVAIKVLKTHLARPGQALERFFREAKIVAQLQHPGIVDVHGIGRISHCGYFLVMDLIEGESLDVLLRSKGPLPVKEALEVTAAAADAVAYAHGKGIIHRDLKPSNVMLDKSGRVVLTDFGLAKSLEAGETELSLGLVLGTAGFMPPEQANPRFGDVAVCSDIYGLGGLLYALLTNRPPRVGMTIQEIVDRVKRGDEIECPSAHRSDLPRSVVELCNACLSRNPLDRPPSAADVAQQLRKIRQSLDQPPPEPVRRLPRRVFISAGLAAAGCAALVAPWMFRDESQHPPVTMKWTVDLYQRDADGAPRRLTDQPASVTNGDFVRCMVEFSAPGYAAAFWIDNRGTIQRLYPAPGSIPIRLDRLTLPTTAGEALPVTGEPGTEVCLVVWDRRPIDVENVGRQLQNVGAPPSLADSRIVVDHQVAVATVPLQHMASIDKLAGDSRAVGKPAEVPGESEGTRFARWLGSLSLKPAQYTYMAIPHAEK